jgi:hypothetical protein
MIPLPSKNPAFSVDTQGQLRRIPSVVAAKQFTDVLQHLDNLETIGWRMIGGIGHFLTSTMWAWMRKQLILLGQIMVKAVRVAMVFTCWAVISFGPILLMSKMRCEGLPVLMALAWTGLALGGSLWGVLYIRHRLRRPAMPRLFRRIFHWRMWRRSVSKPKQEKPPAEASSSKWFEFDNPRPQKGTVVVKQV